MKLDIYVEKYGQEGVFENIDLFDDESFMMEFKLKDNADLSKVFSTYSKEVVIPASPRNNMLLNHYFDQNVDRAGSRYIKAKIYLNEELFRTGILMVTEGKYKDNRISTYKIHFNTGLTSLKDKIGNDELSTFDFSYLDLVWSPEGIRDAITNTAPSPEVVVPLVSRTQVWTMSGDTKQNISTGGKGFIRQGELRPAIKLSTLVDKIFQKYNLNVDLPFKNESHWNELYLWCNNKLDREFRSSKLTITQPLTSGGFQDPAPYFSGSINNNDVIINFTGAHTNNNNPYELSLNFTGVKDPYSNLNYVGILTFIVTDDYGNTYQSRLDATAEQGGFFYVTIPIPVPTGQTSRRYSVYVTAENPLKYNNLGVFFKLRNLVGGGQWGLGSSNNPPQTLQDNFNFQYAIGNIKILDLLTSIIKMYNIIIVEDKLTDKLTFLRPEDIQRKLIDLTEYVDVGNYTKETGVLYKDIIFTHKESDFNRNELYKTLTGKEYGSEVYKSTDVMVSDEYKIETDFQVMNWLRIYGGDVITSYGFDSPDSPIDNEDSIVIMAKRGLMNIRNNDNVVSPLYIGVDDHTEDGTRLISFNQYIAMGNQTTDGKSITFDYDFPPQNNIEQRKSLYALYYSHLIKRMYEPNTRMYKFEAFLPTNVLNNFNMLDEVIIGDEKYTIEEASIDISSGKSKFKLMNVVADNTAFDAIPVSPQLLVVIGESKTSLRVNYNGSDAKYGVKGHWIEYRVLGSPTWLSWGFNPAMYNNQVSYSILIEDLQPDTMYEVRVRTEDNIGNFSGWKVGQGKTLDHNAYVLEPPTNLYLNSTEYDKIEVGWNNFGGQSPTEELEGYEIQWKRGVDVNWASMFIPRTWSDQQSYIIILDNLLGDTLYDVRIRSKDTFGRNSEWKSGSITTPSGGTTPTLPTPVLFTVGSPYNNTIKFKWTGASVANSQGVNGYEIKANLEPSGTPEYSQIIPLGSSPQYDINLNVNLAGVYKCKVRAVGDNNTFSNWSADLLQSVNSN